jgi:hypothetical protein
MFATIATAALASVLAIVAVPRPATADPVYMMDLIWIRCQTDTGEWGPDEIQVRVDGQNADYFDGFEQGEQLMFRTLSHYRWQLTGETLTVSVWELDDFGGDDFQGSFVVSRAEANTGQHSGFAYADGQWIVRYIVYTP